MSSNLESTLAEGPSKDPEKKTASGKEIRFIGLDLGTNTSCIMSGKPGDDDIANSKLVPSVVGYVPDDIVQGVLPTKDDVFYGEKALENELHLHLVWPLEDGIVRDISASKDFISHLKKLVGAEGDNIETRAVVGMPANADKEARDLAREVSRELFDRILLIPEPFLAALGFRDDSRLGQDNYIDPIHNSLQVDIGAGTTDFCLIQGRFPGMEDQISIPFAGDALDALIMEKVKARYPDFNLSTIEMREIKEAHSYVGDMMKEIEVEVVIGGKGYMIQVGDIMMDACNELLKKVHEFVKVLIAKAPSRSSAQLLQNIYITGGGSRIKGIDTQLQKLLQAENYKDPKVRTVGIDYKRHVAMGALKAARAARDNQWQISLR